MPGPLVIDTCSLMNFFRYYYFDLHDGSKTYTLLRDFLIKKINADEIIILDKVANELKWSEFTNFKKEIRAKIKNTGHLVANIKELSEKYYIKENETNIFKDNKNAIEEARRNYENDCADLYLVAHCMELKSQGHTPILITEETTRKDGKLHQKIPTMCKTERIECKNIPHVLFEIYQRELIFTIEVK